MNLLAKILTDNMKVISVKCRQENSSQYSVIHYKINRGETMDEESGKTKSVEV